MKRYYKYSQYLKNKYGVKTYKLPVNLPLSCPNRDGNLGEGGCDFCGEDAANFATEDREQSVKEQLLNLRDPIGEKYGADKFIAYFQNFSNTYLPLPQLIENIKEAQTVDGVVEVALATRPDCINREYLQRLRQEFPDLSLTLELGLQTVNYHVLANINRHHTLAEFIDAVLTAKKFDIEVGVHIILNLPGDRMIDARENARVVSALGADTVKLHALYIREGTVFAEKYKNGDLQMISMEEYRDRVITFLENLNPEIAVQRLLGRAPAEGSLFVNWDMDWTKIQNSILNKMEENNSYQGKKFDYLQGKALKKFTN